MEPQDFDSFSICFNIMKIRYAQYAQTIEDSHFLRPGDKVNVFVNVESVLKLLSSLKDVDKKVYNAGDTFSMMIAANLVNLAAHYRKFFRADGLDTNVILYMTDVNSTVFNESQFNPDFRSYYLVKYLKNPKYSLMGEKLINEIIPRVKMITENIRGVYFVTSRNIDSSVVPFVVSQVDSSRKNLVVTSEYVDTEYSMCSGFLCHYIRRSPMASTISCSVDGHLRSLIRKSNEDYSEEINIYSNKGYYSLLFATLGEQYRSVDGIQNIGSGRLLRMIVDGMRNNDLTMNTNGIDMLKTIFPEDLQPDVESNYLCLDIESMVSRLTLEQIYDIKAQLIDRSNNNGLLEYNNHAYFENRLMLEELTV